MLPTITLEGRAVADSELRFTGSGKAVCGFRVAASDAKKDDAGNWETTEQLFVNVSVWDGEAEEVANRVLKGTAVTVTGRLYQREYETNSGEKRTSLELKFAKVALPVTAAKKDRQQPAPRPPVDDPWGAPRGGSDEPPF